MPEIISVSVSVEKKMLDNAPVRCKVWTVFLNNSVKKKALFLGIMQAAWVGEKEEMF